MGDEGKANTHPPKGNKKEEDRRKTSWRQYGRESLGKADTPSKYRVAKWKTRWYTGDKRRQDPGKADTAPKGN